MLNDKSLIVSVMANLKCSRRLFTWATSSFLEDRMSSFKARDIRSFEWTIFSLHLRCSIFFVIWTIDKKNSANEKIALTTVSTTCETLTLTRDAEYTNKTEDKDVLCRRHSSQAIYGAIDTSLSCLTVSDRHFLDIKLVKFHVSDMFVRLDLRFSEL